MVDKTENSQQNNEERNSTKSCYLALCNPTIIIVFSMLVSVFVLFIHSMFNEHGGLLSHMAEPRFARGLITYLFSTVTIGMAVALAVFALDRGKEDKTQRFQRGKEILSLLLGIFGTIVGFYFGSELSETKSTPNDNLFLTQPLLDENLASPGQVVRVTANVQGGMRPYRYGISMDETSQLEFTRFVLNDGWIATEFTVPDTNQDTEMILRLGVEDAAGEIFTRTSVMQIVNEDN